MVRWKVAGLLGLGLALSVVGLAAASPGQDAKIATGDFELSFNSAGSAWAFCPDGQVAVGGGLGVVSASGDPNVAINVSGPVNRSELTSHTKSGDLAREWYASSYSGEGSDTDFKVFAICSRSSRAKLRVKRFRVGPSKTKSAVVACPRHERALGGGLGVGDGPEGGVYELSSGPLGRSGGPAAVRTGDVARRWLVTVYNGFGVTRNFKALVTCAHVGNARMVVKRVNVNPNSTTGTQANCPPGERALGGGLSIIGRPTVDLQMLANGPQGPSGITDTTTDGDVAQFWEGDFYNRSSTTRNFDVVALCASS